MGGHDAAMMRAVAQATVAKVDRDLPRPTLRPAKVMAVDSDDSAALTYVTVLLAGDRPDNPTTCVSLVGHPAVGALVMVHWEPPQQFFVVGYLSRCDPRTELVRFSSASVLSDGAVSAPGRVETDGEIVEVFVDLRPSDTADTVWKVYQSDLSTLLAAVTVPAGQAAASQVVAVAVPFQTMPMFAVCENAGNQAWESVTVTCVMRMGCSQGALAEVEEPGPE